LEAAANRRAAGVKGAASQEPGGWPGGRPSGRREIYLMLAS